MKKNIIYYISVFSMCAMFLPSICSAGKYWVFFKDKDGMSFDPYTYFDAKAIERRIINNVPLSDYTDWPVRPDYIRCISDVVDSVRQISRWFNAAAVCCNEEQITAINTLSFVKKVAAITSVASVAAVEEISDNSPPEELLAHQLNRFEAHYFYDKGIDGKGVRIAIFDAGFPTVDENLAFEHIRKDNRIIKTWDFVRNKENVYAYSSHGMMVFSCIGGLLNGDKIGLATGAEYLLARTEIGKREPYSEEENWLAAVEWADKNGAQIINSSLAYTFNRYFPSEMDGEKSLVARAANMAASKGILVVNAAGNDGNKQWKIIGTPADADSVLSVGGINPYTNYHISFSSFGPNANNHIKPNVCAFGRAVVAGKKFLIVADGTSFASPLVAGFAACALQSRPGIKTMDLFHDIERSADLYPYFDYAHGYGVPQAYYFTSNRHRYAPTFDVVARDGKLYVRIFTDTTAVKADSKRDVKATPANPDPPDNEPQYLYYHIENDHGVIEKYSLISVESEEPLIIDQSSYHHGKTLMLHYKGYTTTYKF